MVSTQKDPQWVWCRRPGGVKYRLHLLNPVDKIWEIEIMSIQDNSLRVHYPIPASQINQPVPFLHQALFEFAKMSEERARRERDARLRRRDAEFQRAIQAGGEWEPGRQPEPDSSQESGQGIGSVGNREDSPTVDPKDSEPGTERVPRKSKAASRKTSSGGKSRGRPRKVKTAGDNSTGGSESAADEGR